MTRQSTREKNKHYNDLRIKANAIYYMCSFSLWRRLCIVSLIIFRRKERLLSKYFGIEVVKKK